MNHLHERINWRAKLIEAQRINCINEYGENSATYKSEYIRAMWAKIANNMLLKVMPY